MAVSPPRFIRSRPVWSVVRVGTAAALGLASALGQGSVMFGNKVVGVVDAPVFAEDGQTRLDGTAFLTQLYVAVQGAPLRAVDTPVGFRSGTSAGYIVTRVVTLAGVPGGTRLRVEMRAWEAAKGGSYEAASANGGLTGASPTFEVVCGAPPSLPADLVGLRSFSLGRIEPARLLIVPRSETLAVGTALAWLAEATGTGPISYQWYKDGAPLAGAVGPALEIPAVRLEDSGVYRVRASNPWSADESPEATLLVLIPPTVQRQPQPQAVVSGGTAVLSVEVAGSPPLSYQWRRDGRDLEGANQPLLSLATFAAGDAGVYSVRVANPVGSVESEPVQVQIAYTFSAVAGSGGSVDWEPRAAAYPPGTLVRIVATPDDGFAFRGWTGVAETSENPLSLTLAANAELAAAFGPVNGTVSFLNRVLVAGVDAPVFDEDGVTRLEGTAYLAQLYGGATADDLKPVGPVVWFGTGTGAGYFTSDRYPTRAVPPVPLGGRAVVEVRAWAADDGASYEAAWLGGGRAGRSAAIELQTGGAGDPPSFPADLVGLRSFALERARPPHLDQQPADSSVASGQSVELEVVATGTEPLSYQWYQGPSGNVSQPIPGATSRIFQTPSLTTATLYWVRVTNAAGAADSRAATVAVLDSPTITQQPADASVVPGQSAMLVVVATGVEPLSYQWYQEIGGAPPQPIPGANASTHTTAPVEATTRFWVWVGNAVGSTDSQKATVRVIEPLRITRQPVGAGLALGSAFALSVTATGVEPLRYQWRRNDQDIPGATDASHAIPAFGLEDAGIYSAEVSNEHGAIESDHVSLSPSGLALLELVDQFEDRRALTSDTYQGLTNNLAATSQEATGEPRHAAKPGGKSLWFTWRPRLSGVATFSTIGSGFDTLLGVYRGDTLASLVEVASDEDRGGYLTSLLWFNAVGGADYHIAVDGFAGAAGELILSWGLVPDAPALPQITESPSGRVVSEGEVVTLTVVSPTPGVAFAWWFEGQVLAGETQPDLTFTASPARVGTYRARVTAPSGTFLDSADARIEVVPAGFSVAPDEPTSAEKWQDLFAEELIPGQPRVQGRPVRMGFTPISPGFGARYTDVRSRGPSLAGPAACHGEVAGTRWMRFLADRALTVKLSLQSAEVNAVMAVYRVPPADPAVMSCVLANVNEGPSEGRFLAYPGVDYLVMVAAAGGGSGKVLLTWEGEAINVVLGEPESGFLPDGRMRVVWPHLPAGDYELRLTDDLAAWHREFETNVTSGVIEYTTPLPPLAPAQFYHLRQVLR